MDDFVGLMVDIGGVLFWYLLLTFVLAWAVGSWIKTKS